MEKIDKAIKGDDDPVPKEETEVNWYLLSSRKLVSKEQPCEIEPKESEAVYCDFVIKNDVQTVELYSNVLNQHKANKELVWSCTTLHDIEGGKNNI